MYVPCCCCSCVSFSVLGVVTVVGVFGGVAGVLSLDPKRAKSPDFLGTASVPLSSFVITKISNN